MAKSQNQKLKLLYLVDILERKTDEQHPLNTTQLIEELAKVMILTSFVSLVMILC